MLNTNMAPELMRGLLASGMSPAAAQRVAQAGVNCAAPVSHRGQINVNPALMNPQNGGRGVYFGNNSGLPWDASAYLPLLKKVVNMSSVDMGDVHVGGHTTNIFEGSTSFFNNAVEYKVLNPTPGTMINGGVFFPEITTHEINIIREDGMPGLPGRDGLDGEDGGLGTDGRDGEPGKDGLDLTGQGLPGIPGERGPRGRTGFGSRGRRGKDGEDGDDGPPGSTGPEGPAGPSGPAGPAGPQGPAGADGADGADGDDCDCCCSESLERIYNYIIQTNYEFVTDVTCNPDGTLQVTKEALSEAITEGNPQYVDVCPGEECP